MNKSRATIYDKAIVNKLISKLNSKTAIIGVIGLGYVGLPLLLRYAEVGFKTIGFDIDDVKVQKLRESTSYISHIENSAISGFLDSRGILTTDYSRASEADALIICVPTPLTLHREPDLSYVSSTLAMVIPHLQKGQVVSLESTTYPGTTEELVVPLLRKTALKIGHELFVVYSPEREDPGNSSHKMNTIPRLVSGYSDACRDVGEALYKHAFDSLIMMSSTRATEMTKLLENIYRAVNIGLVNELKVVADKMDIDIYEVIRAASTKPFGYTPFYPGPGLGGHCIPIDPYYLTWKAREFGLNTRFIELAGEVNANMPLWVIDKLTDAMNRRGKAVNGARVLVLGIAYKKNVNDMRESPAVKLMHLLASKGANVDYSDPYIPRFPKLRQASFNLVSVELTDQVLKTYDCVLLVTNHDLFDFELIKKYSQLIIDCRGVYSRDMPNVVQA